MICTRSWTIQEHHHLPQFNQSSTYQTYLYNSSSQHPWLKLSQQTFFKTRLSNKLFLSQPQLNQSTLIPAIFRTSNTISHSNKPLSTLLQLFSLLNRWFHQVNQPSMPLLKLCSHQELGLLMTKSRLHSNQHPLKDQLLKKSSTTSLEKTDFWINDLKIRGFHHTIQIIISY